MIYAAPSLCSTCTSKCGYPLWPDYGPRSCVVSLRFSHGFFFPPGLPINIQNQPEPRESEYVGSVFQALQATSHVSIAIQSTTLNKQGENGELLCESKAFWAEGQNQLKSHRNSGGEIPWNINIPAHVSYNLMVSSENRRSDIPISNDHHLHHWKKNTIMEGQKYTAILHHQKYTPSNARIIVNRGH